MSICLVNLHMLQFSVLCKLDHIVYIFLEAHGFMVTRNLTLRNEPISRGVLVWWHMTMGLLPDTQNFGLRMHRECRERFPRPQRVSDPDMHHGTCVKHVLWCMPGLLTSGFLWSWWRGKRSRHSRRMRNPQFFVSSKMPIQLQLETLWWW